MYIYDVHEESVSFCLLVLIFLLHPECALFLWLLHAWTHCYLTNIEMCFNGETEWRCRFG